uniref:Arabinanase/levansucrase/invertase n=1 Tax=Acrobeloides nanus TaxID=290746 RepID=A0A914D0X3_9BILA
MQYTNEGFESFDPRITLWNNSYYMFYTNNYNCLSPFVTCAITNTPSNMSKWVTQGVPLDSVPTSSVSAPLFATSENGLKQHYLFWSNAQDNLGIAIATNPEYLPYGTSSPSPWNDTGLYLMTPRKDYFDSRWIEPGPPPVRLNSSGDFLFLYNSGNNASVRFAKSTNVGYVILDGKDPTQIVQRSLDPLIIPGLAWETSPETLTMSGLIPHPKGCPDKNILRSMLGTNFISHADCFIGFYGTSKDTGAILVVASWVDMNI